MMLKRYNIATDGQTQAAYGRFFSTNEFFKRIRIDMDIRIGMMALIAAKHRCPIFNKRSCQTVGRSVREAVTTGAWGSLLDKNPAAPFGKTQSSDEWRSQANRGM